MYYGKVPQMWPYHDTRRTAEKILIRIQGCTIHEKNSGEWLFLRAGTPPGSGMKLWIMTLNHIALNITDRNEVRLFYRNILGFTVEYSFPIHQQTAHTIFHLPNETEATIVKKEGLTLELFLLNRQISNGFRHICLEVEQREEIVHKCLQNHYPVIRMERKKGDLLFVKDKSGNIFELKNKVDI